jgi:hypothetical protein
MTDPTKGPYPVCKVCGAVDPKQTYDHDGAAHDAAGVATYDRERAIREQAAKPRTQEADDV